MKLETIYIFGKDTAAIVCAECGRSKRMDVTRIKNIRVPRLVTCSCGATFQILFDRRRYYRKEVQLMGKYALKSVMEPEAFIVTDISQSGIRFQGLSKDLRDLQSIKGIDCGDIINTEFRLDNSARSLIRGKAVVRHISAGYVGADFLGPDEFMKRELGFYMMP